MSNDNLGKVSRFHATEPSLDFAQLIADSIGQEFDREEVRELASTLHERMFTDIVRILDLEIEAPQLHAGVFGYPRAFSAKTDDGKLAVALDMVFDFWVFFSAIIVAVCTFTVPEQDDERLIARDLSTLFNLFLAREDYVRVRQQLAHYLLDERYKGQLLNLASLIARSMTVFVLCHELAHVALHHHEKELNERVDELEADAEAARYFIKLIEHGKRDRNTFIHIDPTVACAPLILTMVLELFETWAIHQGMDVQTGSDHPPAMLRTKQLQDILQPILSDKAVEIAVGATMAISGLHKLLGLKVRKLSNESD